LKFRYFEEKGIALRIVKLALYWHLLVDMHIRGVEREDIMVRGGV
jgi:hypothetical protein